MQLMNRFKKQKNTLDVLFKKNKEPILMYNANLLSTFIIAGIIAMFVPILFSPFSGSKARLIPVYLLSIALFLFASLLFRLKPLKKYSLLGVYLIFFGTFLFAIYLSIINSPGQRATIILGLFCLFPMSVIDRPYRVKLFSTGFYILHTVLAFKFKGNALGVDDTVNCFCFLMLGNAVGEKLIQIRLEAFESKRLLIVEKETDDLTGLKNRGKLFQFISELDEGSAPSGVIMMDIDDFKEYNDRFGHAAGDKLLYHVGSLLMRYEEMFNIQFFRYGGEEFTGLAWGYSLSELQCIAEVLKVSVNSMTDCHQKVSVSIGIADCNTKSFGCCQKYLEFADRALYRAKAEGKNKVVSFNEAIDGDRLTL